MFKGELFGLAKRTWRMGAKAAALTPHSGGRPSTYNIDLVMKLCELMGDGLSLHQACQGKGMPHPATVYRWLAERLEFRRLSVRALRKVRAEGRRANQDRREQDR
jgi:hypothetical protein